MSKKKKVIDYLEIEEYAAEGKSLGKIDGKVIFVEKSIPGDAGKVVLKRNRKNFAEGFMAELKKPSSDRIEPFCQHFESCGGCKWQYAPYPLQLEFKQKEVVENIKRIGKVDDFTIHPILPSVKETHYRNKLEFTFSNKKWLSRDQVESEGDLDRRALGFHVPGKFDRIVDIFRCHLMDERQNEIRNWVRDFVKERNYSFYDVHTHQGFLRNLIIRQTRSNEWMVILQVSSDKPEIADILDHLQERFPFVTSLYYIINDKKNDSFQDQEAILHKGQERISDFMERPDGSKVTFSISPKSFYQTNILQGEQLYRKVVQLADLSPEMHVYDLYTGAGTIALYAAPMVKKIIGIEYIEEAIRDARLNAENNAIKNADFFAGDIKEVLSDAFIESQGKPDLIITDPPRAGMHPEVIDVLLRIAPDRIVYVSCNSSTQARDIALLSEKYHVKEIQPIDMFPHTHHIENIAVLIKKEE